MKFIPKGLTPGNLAIGVGVVVLAPVVLPVVGSIAKPVVKAAIKGVLVTIEGAKVVVEECKESLEDITAEAKAEIAESSTPKE